MSLSPRRNEILRTPLRRLFRPVADMDVVCGRGGHFMWPVSSHMSQYGRGRYGLWPVSMSITLNHADIPLQETTNLSSLLDFLYIVCIL